MLNALLMRLGRWPRCAERTQCTSRESQRAAHGGDAAGLGESIGRHGPRSQFVSRRSRASGIEHWRSVKMFSCCGRTDCSGAVVKLNVATPRIVIIIANGRDFAQWTRIVRARPVPLHRTICLSSPSSHPALIFLHRLSVSEEDYADGPTDNALGGHEDDEFSLTRSGESLAF